MDMYNYLVKTVYRFNLHFGSYFEYPYCSKLFLKYIVESIESRKKIHVSNNGEIGVFIFFTFELLLPH